MRGAYLGPKHSNDDIQHYLDSADAKYQYLDDDDLMDKLADILAGENVVGWFQGRMEFGPRSLGGRSIIGDPRSRASSHGAPAVLLRGEPRAPDEGGGSQPGEAEVR